MQYRQLGQTGLQVSEISMGCNRLGEPNQPDEHWVTLVRRAVELGVNLFDTSESYGWGRSEEILGKAIGNDPDIHIATKISRIQETNAKDFSAKRVIEQAEQSLRHLQRDCIDIYQLHSPSLAEMQEYDWPEAMTRLKEQGKIRIAAVSINDAASAQWLIENNLVGAMQIPYNIIQHGVGDVVFPLAHDAGVGTMARMPMAQGILTGKFSPGEDVPEGHRALMAGRRMEALIELATELEPLTEETGLPLATISLRYAITPKGVSAAIPGARTIEQLEQNVLASNGFGLDESAVARIHSMRATWES